MAFWGGGLSRLMGAPIWIEQSIRKLSGNLWMLRQGGGVEPSKGQRHLFLSTAKPYISCAFIYITVSAVRHQSHHVLLLPICQASILYLWDLQLPPSVSESVLHSGVLFGTHPGTSPAALPL